MKKGILFVVAMLSGIIFNYAADPAPPAPAAQAPPVNAPYVKYNLGPGGLIANWLVLGYLPGHLPPEKNRLDAIGGEEKIAPYGGETVTLKGAGEKGSDLTLTWKTIEAHLPEIPFYMIASKGLSLFVDEKGISIPNYSGYIYCELESTEDQNLAMWLSGGDPIKIWLNGQVIPVLDRLRYLVADAGKVSLVLKKGINRVLLRIDNNGEREFLSMRLVNEVGEPAQNLKVCLKQIKDCPVIPFKYPTQDWNAVIGEIPPVAKSADEQYFGANLSRTMTLLESGGQTKRPVRILFYGQSITCQEWVWLLIRRLRERYPDTTIEAENFAIGGWGIENLNRTIKHEVLRSRPDLVVLHAYQGGSWAWERIIQKIRRETTAEIMIRSAHIGKYEETGEALPQESGESLMLRRLARTYGIELVDCRKEWLEYMKANNMVPQDLRSDGIHLGRKGCVLMAQLYERHFRRYPIAQPWFKTVRRYEAMRPLADRCKDEIELIGDGWNNAEVMCTTSTGKNDSLKLTFYGNRLDLIMPPHNGAAKVLIDGRPLSECNLFSGTRPGSTGKVPAHLMTYYTGEKMREELWELRFTHISGDKKKFRYTLSGSKTGPDGEGDNSKMFVSNSGRITINPDDFLPERRDAVDTKTELEPVQDNISIKWSTRPLFEDELHGIPWKASEVPNRYAIPYRNVTIVDGLPQGKHELTLIPVYSEKKEYFSIDAVEVHCPPLWGK